MDKRTLQEAGGWGVAAGIAAGTLDPLIFLAVGGAVRSVRGGYSVARSAGQVGALSALQTGVSELALQAAQETRTAGESVIAIATSGVLGGLIGGGAAALLSRAERQAVEGLLDMDRKAISEIVEGPAPTVGLAAPAGAAAADVRRLDLVGYGIDKVPGLSTLVEKMSPTLRVFSSDNIPAKRAMADLAETALRFEDNARGIATSFGGAPVSRIVQAQKVGMQLEAAETLKEAFAAYRFGQADAAAPVARAAFDDLRGAVEDNKLAFNDFKREVTNALFSGDAHAIPQVQEAAKRIRANILEPIRAKAVDLKLLDPDAAPKNDPSWFARVWNKQKLAERRPDAVKRFADWLEGEQTRKSAAQQRLSAISDELDRVDAARAKLDARLARLEESTLKLEGAISERAMEARRAGARADVLAERRALIAEEQSEIEEFIAAMREELRDPQLRARVDNFERDYRAMRAAEDKARVSDADLDRIDQQEAKGELRDRVGKMAAEIVLGERRPVKEPSFVHWLVRMGGVRESQGDVFNVVGTSRAMPGLLSKNGRSVDEIGELIYERFRLPERPLESQVLEWLDEALRGRQPGFWLDSMTVKQQAGIDATRFAASLDEAMSQAGFTPKSKADVAAFLRGGEAPARTLDDLDRALADMEAAAIPPSVRLEGVEGELTLAREDIAAARGAIKDGLRGRRQADGRARVADGRSAEAGINVRFNEGGRKSRGRVGILADRQARAQTKRELLEDAVRLQEAAEAEIMGRIERELQEWGGKSAADALSAIKARDKAAVGRDVDAPRLASADRPTLAAVKRILDSDRNLSRQELDARANEIVERILGTPDGRLPYDAGSGGAKSLATPETGEMRGALKSRDFAIPTALVRDLIEDDVEHVLSTVTRTLLPDMALVERFGDVDMTNAQKQIMEASAAKSAAAGSNPKAQNAIRNERDALLRDVLATRDRIRGTYGMAADTTGRNIARFASLAKNVNVVTDLGGAALNSMGDAAGVVMRHGFVNVFRDGWVPFFQRMLAANPATAADKRQLKAMLLAVETQLNLRQHAVADIAENYRPGSRFERAAQWMADKSQLVNGQAFWTDWMKSIAATTASAEILRSVERVAAGRASAKQIAMLAEANIDETAARRIAAAYADGGGRKIDGARLPNTADWKDRSAAQIFEAALQREVDIAVVTPGLEKPLWLSRPVAGMIGQFKSFIAGANERMLIANLQRSDWNTLQGLFAAVTLGMLSYRLYTLASGQKASERPQDWVKEGISRSGVMGWFDEINAVAGKGTRGQADVFRLIGADKPLTRMQSRGIIGALAGPTAGKLERMVQISGAASSGEWTASDTTAVRRLVPFQNLFYLRQMLDQVEKGVNSAFGVPERQPR
ncbi:hypothetical protein [Bosea sp. (in: a-proteobacteria)]|uniref:hypothetical protein n=1 Tax=Bosea sp. (in: a-proteobacteria) TaxID=1871050 RepID=UPI001ACC4626|nr:hypothetical protein [Bosea sp. (in: a-proteobacteria)]MBN9438258.1 hypothetical protein [Bosea sp. (in: a-proteobacteria)]